MKNNTFYLPCCLFLVVFSFAFLSLPALAKASSQDSLRGNWSFIIEPGITCIDFAIASGANAFQLEGQEISGAVSFQLYDSRKNYFPPSVGPFTDQANHYLVTAKNENSNWVISVGLLHDKRELRPNQDGNRFRYRKGGGNFTLQVGRQWDWELGKRSLIYLQQRAGFFIGLNDLDVHLDRPNLNQVILNQKDGRKLSGGGIVANTQLAYAYALKKSWSISLSCNAILMKGKAQTKVMILDASDQIILEKQKLSLGFHSFSLGPSINVIYRR